MTNVAYQPARRPITLIQDVATPHNNVLIREFSRSGVRINLFYAQSQANGLYKWSRDITHEHGVATIYGARLNCAFLHRCIRNRNDVYVIVGWANVNTLLLHLAFFLLRRPYNHWTDLPPQHGAGAVGQRQKALRWMAYKVLRFSRAKVFGVGSGTLSFFRGLNFPEERLVNLPIFVDVDADLSCYAGRRGEIRTKYRVGESQFLLSAGSRIVYEKGFDLLVRAFSEIEVSVRKEMKLVIVGSGEEVPRLEEMIRALGLGSEVVLEKWLDIEDFRALIANSEMFVHPARSESFGATTLAMALGVPVIGSTGAGAAIDRIVHGRNGYLYGAENTTELARLIAELYRNPSHRKEMAAEARKTALLWPPRRGVEALLKHAI